MPPTIKFTLNGATVTTAKDVTLAAAILNAGVSTPRGPLCGMGICMECAVNVDGAPHVRCCQLPVREGMKVETIA